MAEQRREESGSGLDDVFVNGRHLNLEVPCEILTECESESSSHPLDKSLSDHSSFFSESSSSESSSFSSGSSALSNSGNSSVSFDASDLAYSDRFHIPGDRIEIVYNTRTELGADRFAQDYNPEPAVDTDDVPEWSDTQMYFMNDGNTLVIAVDLEHYTEYLMLSTDLAREMLLATDAYNTGQEWRWVVDPTGPPGPVQDTEAPEPRGQQQRRNQEVGMRMGRRRRAWLRARREETARKSKVCFPRRKRNGTRSKRIDSRSMK